jgi:hypothetical protein
MVEVVVAMVVFSIALTGLIPLLSILSRDLQPIPQIQDGATTYKSISPARDGNADGTKNSPAYQQHTWYVMPYGDIWTRKLGASAQLSYEVPVGFADPSPLPIELISSEKDDQDPDIISTGTWVSPYLPPGGGAFRNACRRCSSLPMGTAPTATITWQLNAPSAGWYSVQATWPADTGQAVDALFYVNGIATAPVDQSEPPDGVQDANGQRWHQLTVLSLHKNDNVIIILSNTRAGVLTTGEPVVADGVRIVRSNEVNLVSVDRSTAGTASQDNLNVSAQVTVTVNLPR